MAVTAEIRAQIAAPDPGTREAAALALGRDPDPASLALLKELLGDTSPEVVRAASRSLIFIGSRQAGEEIIPLLRSEDARLRNLAVEILGQIGREVFPQLAALVHDGDRDVRKFAVDVLKGLKTPEAEEPLIRALFDADNNVSAAAAEGLGILGARSAVPYLVDCLEKTPWLRYAALKSLGEIGGEEALQAMLKIDMGEEPIILFYAVEGLGKIGDVRGMDLVLRLLEKGDPVLFPALVGTAERLLRNADAETVERARQRFAAEEIIALLKNDSAEAVRSAIGLLERFREERAVEALVGLYDESNKHLFEDLERAFLAIRSERVEPFIALVGDPMAPDSVKGAALGILGRMGRKEAFEPLVVCLENGRDELKKEIVPALAALGDRRALPVLHRLLESEPAEIGVTAVEGLEVFRDPTSIPLLMGLATDPSAALRSAAASSLSTYPLEDCGEELAAMLKSERPEATVFALEAIPEALSIDFEADMLALCRHPDPKVRKKGVEHCGRLHGEAAFAAAVRALGDPVAEVRRAAIRSLERFPEQDPGGLLLEAAAADAEEWNRYEAVQGVGRLGRADLLPALISLLEPAPDLVKAGILDVLGELGGKEYLDLLRRYGEEGDETLREVAVEAFEKIQGRG